MNSYPAIAFTLVEQMRTAAEADVSRAIAFQGAPGANSHIAALEYDPDCLPFPCFSFAGAIDAVKEGRADRAIIPIENSQNGRVADMHFLLPESGLWIIAEHFMPIHHCLMATGDGPFTTALSHPQALGQCRFYLREKGIIPMDFADTAAAAARVAEMQDPNVVAIAPKMAAELYGLKLVHEGIEDATHNTTRFVVLSRHGLMPAPDNGPVMTTMIFEVKNVPAALYKAMGGFATNGVNMTKLESYQQGGSFAATEFYADVEGMKGQPAFDRALEELLFHTKYVRILGSYPQQRARGVE